MAGLVEMCDIVIAAATAQILPPEITLAVMPGAGRNANGWPGVVGKHMAMDLLLTGRFKFYGCCSPGWPGFQNRSDEQLEDAALAVAKQVTGHFSARLLVASGICQRRK